MLTDLDFTKPPLEAGAAVPESLLRPQSEIGSLRPEMGGNFIYYVRARAAQAATAPNAPILVVEDDPDTQRLLEKVLTMQGFAVRTAADSRQFQDAMRHKPLPCLVLLDVELPRISGFKLLTALRQHPQTSAIPVVMVTARTANKDLLYGLSLGADGYLSKPFTVDTLHSMIAKILPGHAGA